MKSMIVATATAIVVPMLASAPASANSPREIRAEQRECQRELRRADSRREYVRERRECRREINRAVREYRNEHRRAARVSNHRRHRSYGYAPRYNSYGYAPSYGYSPNYGYAPQYGGAAYAPYYADRYYRSGSYYPDRRLSYADRIYRGYDGRYYCRRGDGTTGLIVGASLGALLGQQLNIGGSAQLSALIGGAAGAVLGRSLTRGQLRCD